MKITLRAARVNAGLDQADVARELGVNIATVSSWETGKTKPSLDNFQRMCELYDWPAQDVVLDHSSRE